MPWALTKGCQLIALAGVPHGLSVRASALSFKASGSRTSLALARQLGKQAIHLLTLPVSVDLLRLVDSASFLTPRRGRRRAKVSQDLAWWSPVSAKPWMAWLCRASFIRESSLVKAEAHYPLLKRDPGMGRT